MKVISVDSLNKKINFPHFLHNYAYGSDENKIKILLESMQLGVGIIEDTELDHSNFYNIRWNKDIGQYYLKHATTIYDFQ
jgi:hypothetical protein